MRTSNSPHRSIKGFTLIELMVTVTILAIISAIAVPSFNGLIASTRLSSATNEVYTSLAQAKSEAVRRGKRVTVCASADLVTCSNDPSGWNTGWITFVDSTRTTVVSLDGGEEVIAVGQAVNDVISMRSASSYFSFSADARSRGMNGDFLAETLRVCSTSSALDDSKRSRSIQTIISGRLSIKTEPNVAVTCPSP
jgi:type IV fimbrial biogenesis protein FimT